MQARLDTEILKRVPLLAGLAEAELGLLAHGARRQTFKRDRPLFYEGQAAPGLHFILSGEVAIQRLNASGGVVTIAIRRAGEYVGELSLLDSEPASATVIATTETSALILPAEVFARCLAKSPEMCLHILRTVAQRLRKATDSITLAHTKSVKCRVACLLLESAEGVGEGSQVARVNFLGNQREIGERIGATREAVNRALSALIDDGSVVSSKNRGSYKVNVPRLSRHAQR